MTEITENPNPARRQRSNPRVLKRCRHNNYRKKQSNDKTVNHKTPPRIKIIHPILT